MNRKDVAHWLATWFGCGLSPAAPGTVGSAAGILIAWALNHWFGWTGWPFALMALLLTPIGIWASELEEEYQGKTDPGSAVIDEVAGQWLTLAGALRLTPTSWLLAFLFFRILDIWKPFPAGRLQSLHGGYGIMIDDLVAGLYGALVLYLLGCFNLY